MSGNVMIDPQISEARRIETKSDAPSLKLVDTFGVAETTPHSARIVSRTNDTIVLDFDRPKVRRNRTTNRRTLSRGIHNIIFDTAVVIVMASSAAASIVALLTMGRF